MYVSVSKTTVFLFVVLKDKKATDTQLSVVDDSDTELPSPRMVVTYTGTSTASKVVYNTFSPDFNEELKIGFKVLLCT